MLLPRCWGIRPFPTMMLLRGPSPSQLCRAEAGWGAYRILMPLNTHCQGMLCLSAGLKVLGRANAATQTLAAALPCFVAWPRASAVGFICSSSQLPVLVGGLDAGEC